MSEGIISGGIVGGIISGLIATSLFTKLSSPNLKINIDEKELDIQDDKTMHVRVRNDKRFCIVNTAYECTGYMCIYFKKQYSKNYIVNRLRGPYILKWTSLPPSDYKRAETIIDIPNDIKEKSKLGRQLDLFRVKVINNENYIIIQDPQQQASRNTIIQNYESVIQKCCPQCNSYLSQNLPALVAVDLCFFDICENNDTIKQIRNEKNILPILFEISPDVTYYMAVKVICANAESKIEMFKIAVNNNKIKLEKCEKKDILDEIKNGCF